LYSGLPAGVAFAAAATEKAFRAASFWAEGSPPLDLVQESRSEVMLCVNALCLLSIVFGLIMMANERVRRRLEELASTDPLTGLSNRRCFFEKASACCRRLADGKVPASILMMDLDKFSSVNKRFGHHGGDRALAAFAVLARDLLRSSDLIGRYGGEEFCVLLRDADAAEAGRIAERLRAGVAALSIDIAGRSLRFTVSIGLASLVDGDLEAAIHQADAALYRAKALGRDRVCGVSAPDVWTGDERPVAPLAAAALAPA
jgi:diguanylate cyclase (GGDEF)-like protein